MQTWNAEQHPLPFAKHHDYLGFVAAELRYRQDVGNPPTGYLAMIRVTSTVEALVKERIAEIAQELRARIAREKATLAGVELLGPVASPIERINQRFRWQLLLRSRERAVLRLVLAAMRGQMGEQRTSLGTSQATIDVDPCDFL